MPDDKVFTIKDIARKTGMSATTLRFYGKKGLLDFVERDAAGVRIFTEKDFEPLFLIHTLKRAGMPIRRIKEFLDLYFQGDETIPERRALYERQREAARAQIAELEDSLAILDYKCWYMGEAERLGDAWWYRSLPREEIPQRVRDFYEQIDDFVGAED